MFNTAYGTMYYVDDMAASIKFYSSHFGIKPSHESEAWTEFSIGGHNLCLHAKDPEQTYKTNGVLIFHAKGVKNLFGKMQNEGVKVSGLHEVHPGAWSFHAYDLTGNEISIYGEP